MIAYRVELWCDGCGDHFGKGVAHDDHESLPNLGRTLIEQGERAKWITDGAGHYCPKCQRQRKAG